MSFLQYKETIEDGDTVIIFVGHKCMHHIVVDKNKTSQTKYGAFRHADLIGKSFGSKVPCSKGWVYVLYPTPELWTINLPHRTQILYATDISMITLQLELKPGSIVCEAGTGSGSLSHAILRTIAPNGHLNTFDFHEQRAQKAREEFESHGFADLVTASHRDVCSAGFGLNLEVDAVFLDLPAPWTAIASAKQAIKLLGGRICSFSPCIEQVQRTCLALTEHDFTEVCTMECLLRTFDVRRVCMPAVLDLGDALCEDGSEPAPNKQPKLSDAHSVSSEATTAGEDHGPHGTPKMAKGDIFFKASVPPLQMAAHTGYLTFATLSPRLVTD